MKLYAVALAVIAHLSVADVVVHDLILAPTLHTDGTVLLDHNCLNKIGTHQW